MHRTSTTRRRPSSCTIGSETSRDDLKATARPPREGTGRLESEGRTTGSDLKTTHPKGDTMKFNVPGRLIDFYHGGGAYQAWTSGDTKHPDWPERDERELFEAVSDGKIRRA